MNAREARYKLEVARTLLGTGMLHPVRPDKTLRSLAALQRWGPTPAAAYTGAAIRYPDRAALIDDRGALTFAKLHRRTNALARELARAGTAEEDAVAIMCRNHRLFIEATVALPNLGAGAPDLNAAFAGPVIADLAVDADPVSFV